MCTFFFLFFSTKIHLSIYKTKCIFTDPNKVKKKKKKGRQNYPIFRSCENAICLILILFLNKAMLPYIPFMH